MFSSLTYCLITSHATSSCSLRLAVHLPKLTQNRRNLEIIGAKFIWCHVTGREGTGYSVKNCILSKAVFAVLGLSVCLSFLPQLSRLTTQL
jgi:hypothetical protein